MSDAPDKHPSPSGEESNHDMDIPGIKRYDNIRIGPTYKSGLFFTWPYINSQSGAKLTGIKN